jgi:hypothetical protein
MDMTFSLETIKLQQLAAIHELQECNQFTEKFGLTLSKEQIQRLVNERFDALKENGRIEFGEGVLKKLVYAFCSSPYLYQFDYEDTVAVLQEIFYYFKNESDDRLSDDELIAFMRKTFDGKAQGSMEYLAETSLEELCRNARYGYKPDRGDSL